jgi:NADH-ubiquinone oxidoreductase chain 5
MAITLIILAICSIFSGFLLNDIFTGLGSDFLNDSIFILPQHLLLINSEFITHTFKIMPTVFSLLGALISLLIYNYFINKILLIKVSRFGQLSYNFLINRWYFDTIYNETIVKYCLYFGYYTYSVLDKGILEIFGPFGSLNLFFSLSNLLTKEQFLGHIFRYIS